MAAPRSSSLRALRQLSSQHSALPARRCLHITGVQSAQPANPADKASLYAARTLPDLKLECQRRSIRAAGSKSELVERLSNHDILQTRAFSIAMRRINPNAFAETRQFNTSRSSSAVGDSSTVDFVYMPTMSDMDATTIRRSSPQIPVLPDMHSIQQPSTIPTSSPMKPQIYTVSGSGADVAASAMSEVVDNVAVDLDPFSLTEAVGRSRVGEEIQRTRNGGPAKPGVVSELWAGFLDDAFGPKEPARK